MFKNPNCSYISRLALLLLLTILKISCDCKNYYVGQGEVTESMIEDVKKAIEERIKEKPQINADSIRAEFDPLLETLIKLQKGEKTDISLDIVRTAAELGKSEVVQAFIDIMTREVHDIQLEHDLNASLTIAKMNAEAEALMKKLDQDMHQTTMKEAKKEEEKRQKEEIEDLERKKLEGKRLQALIERRQTTEQAGLNVPNPKIFVPSSRKSNLKRIRLHIKELHDNLAKVTVIQDLSQKEQEKIKYIVNCIEKEKKEIKQILTAIHYVRTHPEAGEFFQQYKFDHLEIANKLLEDLKNYKEELRQLLAAKGEDLADYEEEPEVETEEEKIAYRKLEEVINDPSDTIELIAHSKQEMQALLEKMEGSDSKRQELKQEAIQVATKIQEVLGLFKAKEKAIEKLYFNSDIKDYVNRPIDGGIQKIKILQEAIDILNKSNRHFCRQFVISWPSLPSFPIITKRELQWAFTSLVDQLVPESELVRATLQSRPLPQTLEAWANLGIEVGFDFIPYGKELKLLAGPNKPDLQQKMKDLIILLLKKQASETK